MRFQQKKVNFFDEKTRVAGNIEYGNIKNGNILNGNIEINIKNGSFYNFIVFF